MIDCKVGCGKLVLNQILVAKAGRQEGPEARFGLDDTVDCEADPTWEDFQSVDEDRSHVVLYRRRRYLQRRGIRSLPGDEERGKTHLVKESCESAEPPKIPHAGSVEDSTSERRERRGSF